MTSDPIRIAPQSGVAFLLRRGQTLRVTDPQGQQVADLIAFAAEDRREWLSSGRTIDYASRWLIGCGDRLYSNRSRVMLEITADTCGRHDFLLTPCSLEMFHKLYNVKGHHPSCHENLYHALAEFGISADDIPTTFNIFMNVSLDSDGGLRVLPPTSKPGDRIELVASMDLIIGLTACSAEQSNNGSLKPIDYQVISPLPPEGITT